MFRNRTRLTDLLFGNEILRDLRVPRFFLPAAASFCSCFVFFVTSPIINSGVNTKKVACGEYDFGIVMCGTGIGISLAANKVCGIRCANVSEAYSAAMSRRHNNCNMLALGGRTLGDQLALTLIDAFLDASFEGGRHEKRVGMIMAIEEEESSDTLK